MSKEGLIICFNTPSLGGAERSMVHQALLMKDRYRLKFLIPVLGKRESTLFSYLKKYVNEEDILLFNYPRSIYEISRKRIVSLNLVILPFAFIKLFINFFNLNFKQFDVVWLNGNKIALPFLVLARILKFRGKVVWHHRDYLSQKLYTIASFFLSRGTHVRQEDMLILANSHSVLKQLKSIIKMKDAHFLTLYNPTGFSIREENRDAMKTNIKTLGIVSMMAPWKGIHQVLLMVKMYKCDLQKLGITRLNIYGDNIYHTKGDHQGYLEQLKYMAEDDFVFFKGNCPPEIAFEEIDLLIHSSLRPEPFGRVLLESFLFHVPVLSTALGGASELVVDGETGIVFQPYDYSGLFHAIEKLATDGELASTLQAQAYKRGTEIEEKIRSQLKDIDNFIQATDYDIPKDLGYGKNSTYL